MGKENPWVCDVTDETFEASVVERSRDILVVVDFWAPWCGPCRTLGPLLEQIIGEYPGEFLLAKVNVDDNPGIAETFGIQGIPAVKVLRAGKIVDEFVGALPEPQVRDFFARLLPTEADRLAGQAAASASAQEGETLYRKALELDVNHPEARLGLARIVLERDSDEGLQELAKVLPGTPQHQEAERIAAAIRMKADSGESVEDLLTRLEKDPADLGARLKLGRALAATGRYELALDHLLEIVRRDRRYEDEAARRAMLDVFEVLGPEDPLTERFRSDRARILFS